MSFSFCLFLLLYKSLPSIHVIRLCLICFYFHLLFLSISLFLVFTPFHYSRKISTCILLFIHSLTLNHWPTLRSHPSPHPLPSLQEDQGPNHSPCQTGLALSQPWLPEAFHSTLITTWSTRLFLFQTPAYSNRQEVACPRPP